MTNFYMNQFLETFSAVVANNRSILEKNQLTPFVGWWYDSAVLKLQKMGWSSPASNENPIHSGIFFSIWLGEEDVAKSMFNYNIHALKLRSLSGYAIKSREFADDFRAVFANDQHSWKNVSVSYGPQTLMQGHVPLIQENFEMEVDKLIKKFIPLCTTIDKLLQLKKKA